MIALFIFVAALVVVTIVVGFVLAIASGAVGVIGAIFIIAIEVIIGLLPIILIVAWLIKKFRKKN